MLNFSDISIRRGTRVLFEKATFNLYRGEKIGITGENGSGKSTLMALVRGEVPPETGHFDMPPTWRWRMSHRNWTPATIQPWSSSWMVMSNFARLNTSLLLQKPPTTATALPNCMVTMMPSAVITPAVVPPRCCTDWVSRPRRRARSSRFFRRLARALERRAGTDVSLGPVAAG